MLLSKNGVQPKPNIIDNIYSASKDAFDLGTLEDFKNNLQKGNTRMNIYQTFLDNGVDVGTFEDFEYNVKKGMTDYGMAEFFVGNSEFGKPAPVDYAPPPQTKINPMRSKELDEVYVDILESKGVNTQLDTVMNPNGDTFRDYLNDANANGALSEFITTFQTDKLKKDQVFFDEQYANQTVDALKEYRAKNNIVVNKTEFDTKKAQERDYTKGDVKGGSNLAFDYSNVRKQIQAKKENQEKAHEVERTLAEIMLEREGYEITDEAVENKIKESKRNASSFAYNGLNDIAFGGKLTEEQLDKFTDRIYERTILQNLSDFGGSVVEGLTMDLYDLSKNAVESELEKLERETGLRLQNNVREEIADIMAQEYDQSINKINRFAGNMLGFVLPVAGSIKVTHGIVNNLAKSVPKIASMVESKGIGKVLTKNALESIPVDVFSAHNRALRDSERYKEDYESLFTMYLAMDMGAGAVLGTGIEKFIEWKKLNPEKFNDLGLKIKDLDQGNVEQVAKELEQIINEKDLGDDFVVFDKNKEIQPNIKPDDELKKNIEPEKDSSITPSAEKVDQPQKVEPTKTPKNGTTTTLEAETPEIIKRTFKTKKEVSQAIQDVFGLEKIKADSDAEIFDAVATSMSKRKNITKEDWYKRTFDGFLKLDKGEVEAVARQFGLATDPKGAMALDPKSQRATIIAMTDPDVSTPVHELAHVFYRQIDSTETSVVMDWAKKEGWNPKSENAGVELDEYFARGFENYLSTGKAPTKKLERVFKRFEKWLKDIYQNNFMSKDSNPLALELNDEMKLLYDKILGAEGEPKQQELLFQKGNIKKDTPLLGLSTDKIYDTPSKLLQNVRKYGKSAGNLPETAYKLSTQADSEIQSIIRDVKYEARRFRNAVSKSYKGKITDDQLKDIDQLLKGQPTETRIPDEVAEVVARMRSNIDALSRKMISEGVSQGELALKVEKNLGVYTNRSYKIFDEPDKWRDFIRNNPDGMQIFNKAVSFMREAFPNKSNDELEGMVNEILDKADMTSLVKSGKLGLKDLSILKRKKSVPPEIRALMGEYTDPLVNYSKSITKMGYLIGRTKLLNKIYDDGIEKYLFKNSKGRYSAKVAGDASETMNPLNGLYTTPEIRDAIDSFYKETDGSPTWLKWYMRLNGAVKLGKTVFNPITHVRNFNGNVGFAIMNGHTNILKTKESFKAIFGDMASNDESLQNAYKRYLKLGVVNEDSRTGELADILKDANVTDTNLEKFYDNRFAKAVRSTRKGITQLYQAEDDFWKIYAFENELARYKKAYPDMEVDKLEKEVAEIIRDTYPTYSKVPLGIKNLRRLPVVGGFVSFPAEVFRTTKNSLKLAKKEISKPETRAIGIKRMTGIITAISASTVVANQAMALLGIDEQTDKDRRRSMPDWDKNGTIVYVDDVNYVNLSYTDPHSLLTDPIKLISMSDKELDEAFIEALGEVLSPFASEEIAISAIRELSSNKKENGGQIYFQNDKIEDKTEKVLTYFWDKAKPGFVNTIERFVDPDDKYEKKREIASVTTGLRFSKQDYERSMSFKINNLKRSLIDAKSIYRSLKYYNPSESELAEGLKDSKDALIQNALEAKEDFDSAIRLGIKREVLVAMLKEKRLDTTVRNIILGIKPISTITDDYIKGEQKKKSTRRPSRPTPPRPSRRRN